MRINQLRKIPKPYGAHHPYMYNTVHSIHNIHQRAPPSARQDDRPKITPEYTPPAGSAAPRNSPHPLSPSGEVLLTSHPLPRSLSTYGPSGPKKSHRGDTPTQPMALLALTTLSHAQGPLATTGARVSPHYGPMALAHGPMAPHYGPLALAHGPVAHSLGPMASYTLPLRVRQTSCTSV